MLQLHYVIETDSVIGRTTTRVEGADIHDGRLSLWKGITYLT